MLVVAVGLLAVFALIPILAGVTAQYTHTPLQGVILTDAFAIPNQQTESQYITQSAWFSIRHAENAQLRSVSDISYPTFYNTTHDDATSHLNHSVLAGVTEEWLKEYLYYNPNAQVGVGLINERMARVNSGGWEELPEDVNFNLDKYFEENGKFAELMPPLTTNEYVDENTGVVDFSFGTYSIPFNVNTYNSVYHFSMPYTTRNNQLVEIINDIEGPAGIYEQAVNFDAPDYVYAERNLNAIPAKSSIAAFTVEPLVEWIADLEYDSHLGDQLYRKMGFDIRIAANAHDWVANSTITNDYCVAYSPIYSERNCRWGRNLNGRYRVCWCDYWGTGYRRFTSGEIEGNYSLTLERIVTTSREENGETASNLDTLVKPIIEDVYLAKNITLNERPGFLITYGLTDSTTYQRLTTWSSSRCPVKTVSATSCSGVDYPAWYTNLPNLVDSVSGNHTVYIGRSASRTWN